MVESILRIYVHSILFLTIDIAFIIRLYRGQPRLHFVSLGRLPQFSSCGLWPGLWRMWEQLPESASIICCFSMSKECLRPTPPGSRSPALYSEAFSSLSDGAKLYLWYTESCVWRSWPGASAVYSSSWRALGSAIGLVPAIA